VDLPVEVRPIDAERHGPVDVPIRKYAVVEVWSTNALVPMWHIPKLC
jgi:hypothetical protein